MGENNRHKYIRRAAVIIFVVIAVLGVSGWHLCNNERNDGAANPERVITKKWRFAGYVLRNGEKQPVKISFYQDGTEYRDAKFQDIAANETVDMEVTKEENSFVFEGMKNGITYRIEVIKNSNTSSWGGSLQMDSQTMTISLHEESGN
jgi:hypothetical protein